MPHRRVHRFGKATEPQIVFPLLGAVALALLWTATLALVRLERASAEASAAATTRDLVETYEAQVVRAVREIDSTLKVVKYAYEKTGGRIDLGELRRRALLPPDLVFSESVANRAGDVVASTRPVVVANVADREYFREQLEGDRLSIGEPRQDAETGEWTIRFGRRLEDRQGAFAGVALLTVGASYFVSGYDEAKLGREGLLAVVGTDGVFRARRSGDTAAYGDLVDYPAVMRGADAEEIRVRLAVNPWDGVRRYTGVHQLYDLPLSVVVGLSAAEQLAPAERRGRVYLGRAAAASLAVVVILGWLGTTSWRLADSRRRAAEEQVAHARQVEFLAFHDGLTGLPNRSLFSKLLHQSLLEAKRYQRELAVLFLDLDRFKHINDTLGHEAGDQLLQEVARRLRDSLRESDTVARLGGDEFVVLLPDLPDEAYAAAVAQKVIGILARPFLLLGQEFRVTGSVGVATFPGDGEDEQTLTKNADIAMYKAKEQGKNNFQFYSDQINAESLGRLTLEANLRHALEREEFEVHYQAKRELLSGRVTGMEALLRWQHPDLGTVSPMRFLPVAEETGLIVAIGKWVLRTACAQNVAWQGEGLPRLGVAVNLTPVQFFDPHLTSDVAAILDATGMDPDLLELEISESTLLRDIERSSQILAGLKAMRVRLAVDDFGVGYTTLSSLQQFPLDTIKIDRAYIRDVTQVEEDRALTEAIIAMGKSLSLTVVAQGVETKEQVDFLRAHACDELQGFYFNRPVSAGQFSDVLRAHPGTAAAGGLDAEPAAGRL